MHMMLRCIVTDSTTSIEQQQQQHDDGEVEVEVEVQHMLMLTYHCWFVVEKLLVVLRDGRKLIGWLRSFDQFGMSCIATDNVDIMLMHRIP
jgi:hypothetical protein